MAEDLVLYETDGPVGYVTFNRPAKLNAINPDLRVRAMERFAEADADETTRVVVLRGAGRAFCTGYDIAGEAEGDQSWRSDTLIWRDYLHECRRLCESP